MLKYVAFLAVLGFAWSQSTSAPAATTAASSGNKFYYDRIYHQVVMLKGNSCFFHQLSRTERYDAKDAAGLQAIESKILAAEQRLEGFGIETQTNMHFFSYSHEIREACRGKETFKITNSN